MKAFIQKEIIRKPISPMGEDINGRIESEETIIFVFGVRVYKRIIALS